MNPPTHTYHESHVFGGSSRAEPAGSRIAALLNSPDLFPFEVFMSPNTTSNQARKTKRGKLNLLKCQRCRRDKKNCTPSQRLWPSKCDRCIEKGFPCSEGKRVERKTKHAVLLSPPPQTEEVAHASDLPCSEFDISDWIFKLNYHKIICMALKEFRTLLDNMMRPFIDGWVEDIDPMKLLKDTPIQTLIKFQDKLAKSLITAYEQLTANGYSTQSSRLSPLLLQSLITLLPKEKCDAGEEFLRDGVLADLALHDDVASEFVARQDRLSTHLPHGCWSELGLDNEKPEEIRRVQQLGQLIQEKLHSNDYFQDLPFRKPFYSSQVVLEIFYRVVSGECEPGDLEMDCLGRSLFHELMDATAHDSWAWWFETKYSQKAKINQQDILNRTLLHIACLKHFELWVSMLLRHGADPYLKTHTGQLPLHYAAAAGASEMCKLILDHNDGRNLMDELDDFGGSALYYAVCSRDQGTVEILLEHPFYGNLALRCDHQTSNLVRPPIIMRALCLENIGIIETLVKHGASGTATCLGETVLQRLATRLGVISLDNPLYHRWHTVYQEMLRNQNE